MFKEIFSFLITILIIVFFPQMLSSERPVENLSRSGIIGKVVISPTCPPAQDKKCPPEPYRTEILIQSKDGSRNIMSIKTDENGTFQVLLNPGVYRLHPVDPNSPSVPPHPPDDQVVEVRENKLTQVTIKYDSGIR